MKICNKTVDWVVILC